MPVGERADIAVRPPFFQRRAPGAVGRGRGFWGRRYPHVEHRWGKKYSKNRAIGSLVPVVARSMGRRGCALAARRNICIGRRGMHESYILPPQSSDIPTKMLNASGRLLSAAQRI